MNYDIARMFTKNNLSGYRLPSSLDESVYPKYHLVFLIN